MSAVFVREHEEEPLLGLPGRLPFGERLLWQGSPEFFALACSALHVKKIVLYFCLIMAWQQYSLWQEGSAMSLQSMVVSVVSMLAACGLLMLLAGLYAKTTVYTITNRRIVIRYGIAVPVTLNIPFTDLRQARALRFRDGNGNIALSLPDTTRLSWFVLWPNARPWRFIHPQPMLRSVQDVDGVAQVLQQAVAEAGAQSLADKPLTIKPVAVTTPSVEGVL